MTAAMTNTPADHLEGDEPEFGRSRRRFLIAALMAGWIKPERVVERVVAELEEEASR